MISEKVEWQDVFIAFTAIIQYILRYEISSLPQIQHRNNDTGVSSDRYHYQSAHRVSAADFRLSYPRATILG